jgi:hypothetical protein
MGAGGSRPCTDDASSTPSTSGTTTEPSTTSTAPHLDDSALSAFQSSSTARKEKKKAPENESGCDRAQRICRKQKRQYDACYTAQLSSKEEDCNDLFEAYRTCFLRVMAKDMEKRGVKVKESSMIGEYKEEIADENENR